MKSKGFTLHPRAFSLRAKHGFTLIELLVVVAIIGVLATIVLSSLNDARARARDARRISEMKSFETALELYHLDNGQYPALAAHTESGSTSGISLLETYMAPYINIDLLSDYYYDASGGNASRFYYNSKTSQNFQNYGIMFLLEDSSLGLSDGGYYNFYEIGPNPAYCKTTYPSGNDGNWWSGSDRCVGGN